MSSLRRRPANRTRPQPLLRGITSLYNSEFTTESQTTIWSTIECAPRWDPQNPLGARGDDCSDSRACESEASVSLPPTPTRPAAGSIQASPTDLAQEARPLPGELFFPSTAPPNLGRGKRQRARTVRKQEAVDAGLLADSQRRQQ